MSQTENVASTGSLAVLVLAASGGPNYIAIPSCTCSLFVSATDLVGGKPEGVDGRHQDGQRGDAGDHKLGDAPRLGVRRRRQPSCQAKLRWAGERRKG